MAFSARITVEGLSGGRGGMTLLRDVSFALGPGEALRVTGPNGTGKSTLLRMLAGLVRPDAGTIRYMLGEQSAAAGDCLHYLGHLNAMKPQLTVAENLAFWAGFSGGGAWEAALDAVGLARLSGLPFAFLSAGQKRRVAIARLLASARAIWLIDEPTAGLDAAATAMFEGLLDAHRGAGGIVIGATHVPLGRDDWRDLATGDGRARAA